MICFIILAGVKSKQSVRAVRHFLNLHFAYPAVICRIHKQAKRTGMFDQSKKSVLDSDRESL